MLKLPPPIWALIYVLACTAISWGLGWPRTAGLPLPLLGTLLVVLGFIPPVWAVILFRRDGTELQPTSPINSNLVTRGPFAFTRNPIYLGLTVITTGIAVWIGAWPMFATPIAVFATANWVHIPFEEAKMRRQFPEDFAAYAGRVRRWV